MSGSEHYLASSKMIDNVRTGKCAYEIAHGQPIFEYLKDHPNSARVFDKAMESIHGSESNQILAAYDFSEFITLADIGGGNGSMLLAILNQYPNLHGVLFDLSHVTAATAASKSNVERFKLVSGDFFESVTPNADAYLLRHIIHDWDDEKSILILSNIKKALPKHGKVLMIEAILPEGNTPHPGKMFDWIMMGIPGGIERTLAEYKILFAKSGLHIQRVIPTIGLNSIIEATLL
jgi:cyclopropane fatty-acyl-phospholipid synthase-like methyltransferase